MILLRFVRNYKNDINIEERHEYVAVKHVQIFGIKADAHYQTKIPAAESVKDGAFLSLAICYRIIDRSIKIFMELSCGFMVPLTMKINF
jgi:pyrrolidone-carboxylate peptidase